MSCVKVFAYSIASIILCMFINLTFSVFGGTLIKIVCAICTVGIMLCLQFNSAYNTAKEDMRTERINNKFINKSRPFILSFFSSLTSIVSTVVLWISSSDNVSDFYRIYKILNGHYLQIFNLINPEVITSSLSLLQLIVYSVMSIVPFMTFLISYFLVYKGILED